MKSIIVPTDFSQQSEYALKVATTLAKKHKAEIILLHMLELNQALISGAEGFYPEQSVFLIKMAEKRLTDMMGKPYLKGIDVVPIVKHFKVFSEVNEVAKKHNADLVVMGSHGADGFKEMFVGSNAEKVVRNSDIPVLIIKKDIPNFKVKDFVFGCDFKDGSLLAFRKAKDFADLLGAKLDLVYINTQGDDFMATGDAYDRISKFLQKAGVGQEVEIYNDYSVERGILNYSERVSADLIGIPTHGRKGLSHFLVGSIGEDIANHSKLPVVTFKMG
ncbi:Nucleotide-binding universal stress protein, UspA family [Pricia antarctica]|uniref:Nucleotide-binding universal stress protein, UspA family n=1 Tax=Pricia antarctica TaxID=641691 RepID=A0A1G7C643_9FLAO|nr:universal stress protein [Pricia antarctica]SDE33905.1 Nucleotide-binding universal stress protein, UspA family [Pricia antarctica]